MNLAPFMHAIKDFLAHLEIERNLSDHTIRAYEADLKLFTEFWQRFIEQEHIDHGFHRVAERYIAHLYQNKAQKTSIARKISCLKSYALYMTQHGLPCSLLIERPRIEKKVPPTLSVSEIVDLLDNTKNSELPTSRPLRDKAILELLYASGIRCSELVNIKLKDINIEEKTMRITGRGRKERIALFGEKAKQKIIAYMTFERPPAKNPDEFLFLNYRHGCLTSRSIQRIMEMFRGFLKIDRPLTAHNIRHSFALHLINQGVDIRIVKELMGHRALTSTERYTKSGTAQLMELCQNIHPLQKKQTSFTDQEQ